MSMYSLPDALQAAVAATLHTAGDAPPIQSMRLVGGGCINNALRLDTAQQSYLLKWNPQPLPGLFTVEARGLHLLATSNSVRVPAVIGVSEPTDDHPAYIVLEWLEGHPPHTDPAAQEALGRNLAAMHRSTAAAYGLDHDNYLGSTPQENGWCDNWIDFFRERRLRYQITLAHQNRLLPAARAHGLERLLERLDDWLGGVERHPALLHGDLWGGNVIPGPGGVPALIDPAVYYGDREAEIAYTELFGGFRRAFYAAYQEHYPLPSGYADRRDLYNLYHLLNHLNLFGESYGMQVDSIVRRYVGA